MAKRNQYVAIKVDKNYFDKCFEPDRKKLSNRLGVNFTQVNFTRYIAKSKGRIVFPAVKKTFSPRTRKGRFF